MPFLLTVCDDAILVFALYKFVLCDLYDGCVWHAVICNKESKVYNFLNTWGFVPEQHRKNYSNICSLKF